MTSRVRILLIVVVGIGAAAALAYWRLSQYPAIPVSPVAILTETTTTPTVATTADPVPLGDSAFAVLLARPGVLVPGEGTGASFYFLGAPEAGIAASDYELMRAGDLLDSTFRAELLSANEASRLVGIDDRVGLEARLRKPAEVCASSTDVSFADPVEGLSWAIGGRRGAMQVVPGGLRNVSDSLTDAEAARLIQLVPVDTNDMSAGVPPPAKVFQDVPLRPLAAPFTIGNDEFLFVESTRTRKLDAVIENQPKRFSLVEERMVIGQRRAGSGTPFTIEWTRYSAYDEESATSEVPLMLLRVGPRRTPAILFRGRYRDGSGGNLLGRVAPGRWTEVARWYSGC